MKKAISINFAIVSILILGACGKNFLDQPLIDNSSTVVLQEYVSDLKSCENYLNGIYIEVSRSFYNGYFQIYPDLVADNIKPTTGANTFLSHYNWNQLADERRDNSGSADASNMNGYWAASFKIIRSANYVLENVDRFRNENEAKADNIKGQAFALRAMVHFGLLNIFAQPYKYSTDASHIGVPYVKTSDWTQPISRQTVNENCDALISDLVSAVQLLNPSSAATTLISQNAAKAILSRVYLYKGDYSSAKQLAREVVTAVPIMSSAEYPAKLFTLQEKEAIFQITPSQVNYATNFPSIYFKSTPIQFYATSDISIILNERQSDVRKSWVTLKSGNWNITKFPSGVVSGFSKPDGSYYMTVIRSSEMYLTASECYAKLGNNDSAWYFLDAIRKRADITITPTTATGASLLDSIYKERRKEFAFEGFRIFDLQRTGRSVYRDDAVNTSAKSLPYPNDRSIAPIHAFDVRYYSIEQNRSY